MYCIRPWLYLGSFVDAANDRLIRLQNIQTILLLVDSYRFPDIEYRLLPIEEGLPIQAEQLRQGIQFILEARARGKNILVVCGAGISRSAVFAIAALHEAEGLDLTSAAQEVRRRNPDTLPHVRLWESLCEYYGEKVPYLELIRVLGW